MTPARTPSPYDAESEYEPPVRVQPLTDDERLARTIVEKAWTTGDPLLPLGSGYNAARMGRG